MTLQIYPFLASESKIDGLRIINVKMVTDDRGTVRAAIQKFYRKHFLRGNR